MDWYSTIVSVLVILVVIFIFSAYMYLSKKNEVAEKEFELAKKYSQYFIGGKLTIDQYEEILAAENFLWKEYVKYESFFQNNEINEDQFDAIMGIVLGRRNEIKEKHGLTDEEMRNYYLYARENHNRH